MTSQIDPTHTDPSDADPTHTDPIDADPARTDPGDGAAPSSVSVSVPAVVTRSGVGPESRTARRVLARRGPHRAGRSHRAGRRHGAVRAVRPAGGRTGGAGGRAGGLRPHGLALAVTGEVPDALRARVLADYHRDNLARSREATRARVAAGELLLPVPYGYRSTGPARPGTAVRVGPSRNWRVDRCTGWVVGSIFVWRYDEGASVAEIVGRLAGASSHYPPPRRLDGRERSWTPATVRHILADPAYTGHTVWGRHHHGRPVEPAQWIVSPTRTHPALIRTSVFDDLNHTSLSALHR